MPQHAKTIASILTLIATSISAPTLIAQDRRIGAINFYGYSGLDLNQLRSALPFHEGDAMPPRAQLAQAQDPYARAIGRPRVKFTPNCCLPDGRLILFVGIEEPGAAAIAWNPKPQGNVRLPDNIVTLYKDHDREVSNGVQQGKGGEDDSKGYRLMEFPPARALELKIRDYALAHPADLIDVLNDSSDDTHRIAAALALGYSDESPHQIVALVHASFDPNADVRDEAVRALGILVNFDSKAVPQVPVDRYVTLLRSIDWLDRNKAAFLLESVTRTRDPNVLKTLRTEALVPLREMARWKDFSHALCAVEILGRIAGLEDRQIDELSIKQDAEPILRALP